MKNTRNQLFNLVFIMASSLAITACNRNAEEAEALISDEEAAEIVENMITERTAGMSMSADDMSAMLATVENNCGIASDTTFSHTKNVGPTTFSHIFSMNWLVNCNQLNIPQDATFGISGQGTFAGGNWAGTTDCTGELIFTGLALQADDYTANGTFEYTGTLTGNLRRIDPTLTCVVDIDLANLTINKTNQAITGGTGTAVLSASSNTGQTISINASIVFNGDGTVTVTVNNQQHTFQIN